MIKLCGTASSFFADAASAARTWPNAKHWTQALILFALFCTFAAAITIVDTAFNFSVSRDPAGLLAVAAVAFFIPALAEEGVFRILLAGRRGRIRASLALAAFVLWHPVQVWLALPMAQPVFLEPGFLLVTAALGLTCTLAWRLTGSLWPAVVIHWLTVVGWKGLMAG